VFLPDLTSQNRLLSLDIRNRTRKRRLWILDFGTDGLFEARVPRGLGEARVPHGRARVPSGAARVPPSSECHTLVEDGSEFLGRTIGEGEIVSTLKVLATGKVMDGAGRLLVCPLGRIWILDWIWIWIRMLEDTTMVWSSRSDLTTFFWGTLSLELALLTLVDALRCFV